MTPTEAELNVAEAISNALLDWKIEQILEIKATGKSDKTLYSPQMFQLAARAAIRALRTPTTDMILAGCRKANEEQLRPIAIHRVDAANIFEAMIDAASPPETKP